VGDFSKRIRADVDVCLRLDLSRSAYDRRQILLLRFTGLDGGYVLAALMDRESYEECQ